MAAFTLPFGAALALVSGPVLLVRGFRDLRMRQLIQNTPTARIRSMPMGLVEVCGEASPRSQLEAPFSGRPCAYWQVDISSRTKNGWHVIHRNVSGHPFYLRDETGLALVYPAEATVKLNYQLEEVCAGFGMPEIYSRYLQEHHVAGGGLLRLNSLRFRERALEEGQRVYVLGTAMPRSQSVAVSMDEATEDELEATGTEGRRTRRLQHLDREVQAVVRRGENERTYIISHQSERELTLGLGLKVAAGLVGGPALTLLGLGYWLAAWSTGQWWR